MLTSSKDNEMKWITASDIKNWANVKQKHCAETMPELVRRLILATSTPSKMDFPSGDSTSSGGWDGTLSVETSTTPFVPPGQSGWEIGAEKSAPKKANADFAKRTSDPLGMTKSETTFVFVTPRAFAKRAKWEADQKKKGDWRDVRAVAADALETWLDDAPGIAIWLALEIGKAPVPGPRGLEDVWNEWSKATSPPITPALAIAGRTKEVQTIQDWVKSRTGLLEVRGDSPDEAFAFLYSSISSLPENDRLAALSRTIVVSDLNQFRSVQQFKPPLLIVAPGECLAAAGAAVAKGHQVFILVDGTITDLKNRFLVLTRPVRDAVKDALLSTDMSGAEANKLSRDFGRSLPALHRKLSVSSAVQKPQWLNANDSSALLPALFAGSWSGDKSGDRSLIEALSGQKYDDFISKLTPLLSLQDSPIRKIGSVWAFKSTLEGWFLLAPYLDKPTLEKFGRAVISTLAETDPKYELPPDKRWAANIYGKANRFSRWLRRGCVESLVFLAVYGNRSPHIDSTQSFVNEIVRQILSNAQGWEAWASLQDISPLLAEAAPEIFLEEVEEQLEKHPERFVELMRDEGNAVFGECRHSGLLWALESLAWSPVYFARSVAVLFDLARLDNGGKWQNRPDRSLFTIFLPDTPQTHETPEHRLAALDRMLKSDPGTLWKFTQRYFGHGHFTESYRFKWRDDGGERTGFEPEVLAARQEYLSSLIPLLQKAACARANLASTATAFMRLPHEIKESFVTTFNSLSVADLSPTERAEIRKGVIIALNWINSFGKGKYVEFIPPLSEIAKRLEPEDIFERVEWLLNNPWPRLPDGERESLQETQSRVAMAQQQAARDLLDRASTGEIVAFGQRIQNPGVLGYALGKAVRDEPEDTKLIFQLLSEGAPPALLTAYAFARSEVTGPQCFQSQIDRLTLESKINVEASASLLLALPLGLSTWKIVEAMGAGVEASYWSMVQPRFGCKDADSARMAIERLLTYRRAYSAVEIAGDPNLDVPLDVLPSVLEGILIASSGSERSRNAVMDEFYLGQVFTKLHTDASFPLDALARLEWPFAEIFEDIRIYVPGPFAIHRSLQSDPSLFAELVSYAYRRDDDVDPHRASTDQQEAQVRRLAENARAVLTSWDALPGFSADGTLDESILESWVNAVRERCAESGHILGGDLALADVLSRFPADKDGMWPPVFVRNLIEKLKNHVIEKHIPYGIYNSRGVHTRGMNDGGAPERKIADYYRGLSQSAQSKWPRTASLLAAIAEWYENDAKSEDDSAELNDLRWN